MSERLLRILVDLERLRDDLASMRRDLPDLDAELHRLESLAAELNERIRAEVTRRGLLGLIM